MPRVSVILASLHPEVHLSEAIDGVLNQTFRDLELIICDDGDNDRLWSHIHGYSDNRLKAWCDVENTSATLCAARAISEVATGEYIAFLQSGECWASDKLQKQVAHLDAHPHVGAVFTWAQRIEQNGIAMMGDFDGQENPSRWDWLNELFRGQDRIDHSSMLIRMRTYQDTGPHRCGLDQLAGTELLSRVLLEQPICIIRERLITHRVCPTHSKANRTRFAASIQRQNEWNVLRSNYLSISRFEDVIAIFPSLSRFRQSNVFNVKFLLAMACLYECDQRSAWQLGLQWLYELIENKESYREIRNIYSFSCNDFITLTGDFDVYFMEGTRLAAAWDQQGGRLLEKLVADRDWLIDQRQWLLTQRDGLVAERERLAAEHSATLNEVYSSTSWRLTRPLRLIVEFIRARRSLLPVLLTVKPRKGEAAPSPVLPDVASEVSPPNRDASYKMLLVVHEFSRTGAPYAALSLARALSSLRGVPPVVISPVDGPIREEFEREGFATIVDPSLFSDCPSSPDACRFVAQFDRVFVNSLASFSFVSRFRGQAKRLTWWIHETDVGFTAVNRMTAELPGLLTACEALWLVSPRSFPLAGQYVSQDKLHLLLYGCADRAAPHRTDPSGRTVFCIVGSVERRKGQDIFLDAVKQLAPDLRRKAIFRIVGSPLPGDDESALFFLRVRTKAALIPEVKWLGSMPSDKLRDLYSESNILVSASRDDPMPIVVTEGLMFSMVCVCSTGIGHAQLLEDGKDGLIFASESVGELSKKMAWIIEHPTELPALGRAGRTVYERHFLISDFVKRVGELLQ